MIIFWTVCALMLLAALLYTLWPLIRVDQTGELDELQARVAACQANLQDLEQDVANDNMAAADLAAAREEIELALYQSAERLTKKRLVDRQTKLPLLLVCILLPLLSILTYLQLGQQGLLAGGTPASVEASVETMVASLAERLKQRPEDLAGWTMLARSYMAQGRYAEAVSAYAHLQRLSPDDATMLAGYAGALAMANAGNFAGRPQDLLARALQLEPLNPAALWLSGLAARQSGQELAAQKFWQKLLPQLQDEAAVQRIEALIAQTQDRPGSRSGAAEKQAPDSGTSKRGLLVRITLSEQLRAQVEPSSTVFVIARAPDGPPMPLAVLRRQVGDLPLVVTLDDSAAMSPVAKLSDHKTVRVSARVSLSGAARRQPGDISSVWASVDTEQAEAVILHMDQIVD